MDPKGGFFRGWFAEKEGRVGESRESGEEGRGFMGKSRVVPKRRRGEDGRIGGGEKSSSFVVGLIRALARSSRFFIGDCEMR